MVQSTETKAPAVVTSMLAVAKALGEQGIAKSRKNKDQGFNFRGVDDVMGVLNGLLVDNQLVMLPEALSHQFSTYPMKNDRTGYRSVVHLKLTFISTIDGSREVMSMFGEGADTADKSTGKAQSYAYKDAILKAFSVPLAGNPEDRDPDFESPEGADEKADRKPAPRAATKPAAKAPPAESVDPETVAGALERLVKSEDLREKLKGKILEAYGVMLLEDIPDDKVQEAIQQAETFVKRQAARKGK
jgi:hypothetical protein